MRAVVAEYHQGFYEHVNTLRHITVLATQSQLSIHRFADVALGESEYLAAGFFLRSGNDDRLPEKASTLLSPGVGQSSGSSAADFSRII